MSKQNSRGWTTLALTTLAGGALLAAGCGKRADKDAAGAPAAGARSQPGVTATEIKLGQSMPYSGPASAYGVIGKADVAYFKMINDKGGINGHKVTLLSLDDAYTPSKALENTRKLVEDEGVALMFNSLGTTNNTAVQKYLNDKKVPQLLVSTGSDKWGDPEHFPWTMGFAPSYYAEGRIYAHYLQKEKPDAKLCVLYQNDDFGKDYLVGLHQGFKDQYDKFVIKTASYEPSDPTIDSQVVSLQAAGCDALLAATGPKFAVQTIRKVADIGWKPLFIMTNTSVSRSAVLEHAGLDKSIGMITAGYIKDINDPTLANDPGLNEYREFAKKYLSGMDINDGNIVYAFGVSYTMAKVLGQCGDDFSRENIMKQAANIKNLQVPVIDDGILINTSPTNFHPYTQMVLGRFNGNNFEMFGGIQDGN
jgi:branched-chain amino acid transport system substrate-binding protein